MSEEPVTDPSCAVCGRRLLHGERPTTFVTGAGSEVVVCELCKARAEAAGWLRPGEADALGSGGAVRERRRPRSQMLGGLLSRLPAPGTPRNGREEPAVEEEEDAAAPRSRRRSPRATAASGGEAAGPVGEAPPAASAPSEGAGAEPGVSLPQALAAFNGSDHRRTVAGLSRTLGPPRGSGLAVRASSGHPGVRLTVAWELTWYQWEIGPSARGVEVRESGKGETIDQLRAADRSWNVMVASDGTLQQRTASAGGERGPSG